MAGRWIVGLLAALILAACGGVDAGATGGTSAAAASAAASMDMTQPGAAAPMEAAMPAEGEFEAEASEAPGGGSAADQITSAALTTGAPVQQGQQRLVIRDATVDMLVARVDEAEAQIRSIAAERGGWVLGSQASGEGDERRATISFKVPVERFDDALNALTGLALKVESLDVKGQDVTAEFVDLQSRLRNLQAVEQRLLQFLADAKTTKDALEVNAQLSDIQAQIEQAKGRIAYLEQSSAYSTITASLYAPAVIPLVPEPRWSPSTTAAASANSLLGFAQNLADVAIVLAVWTPLWLPGLLLGLWVWRRTRRIPAPPATT